MISRIALAIDSRQIREGKNELDQMGRSGLKAETAVARLGNKISLLSGLVKVAATAFAGINLAQYIKEATSMAAQYETLGVVMNVVGRNAGYSASEMDGFAKSLQHGGIAMAESRSTLTKMAQATMDLTKAEELARVAQNAAVIARTNSSDAFERMIQGIQRGEIEIMKTLGLNVNFIAAQDKLAASLNTTRQELSASEKIQANMNAAMEAGVGISGVYEASLDTVAKKIGSLARPTSDIAILIGNAFLPATALIVDQITDSLKKMKKELEETDKIRQFGEQLRSSLASAQAAAVSFASRYGDDLIVLTGVIAAAKVAQLLLNTAVLANPYVLVIASLIAANEYLRQFDMHLGSLKRRWDEYDQTVGSMLGRNDEFGHALSKEQLAINKVNAEIERLTRSLDAGSTEKKKWYEFQLFADANAEEKRVKSITDRISELVAELGRLNAVSQVAVDLKPIMTLTPEKSKNIVVSTADADERRGVAAAERAMRANMELANAYQEVANRLTPLHSATKKHAEDLALLNIWYSKNKDKTDLYGVALNNLDDELQSVQNTVIDSALGDFYNDLDNEVRALNKTVSEFSDMAVLALSKEERAVIGVTKAYRAKMDVVWKMYEMGRLTDDEAWMWSDILDKEEMLEAENALGRLGEKGESTAQLMEEAFKGWASNLSQDLNKMVWSADFSFKSILKSFGQMVTQMIIQMKVVGPIMDTFFSTSSSTKTAGGVASSALGSIGTAAVIGATVAGGSTWAEAGTSIGVGLSGVFLESLAVESGEQLASAALMESVKTTIAEQVGNNISADLGMSILNLSSAAFSGWAAGIGTFVISLLRGEDFKTAALKGVGAGLGAYGGALAGTALGVKVGGTVGTYIFPVVGTIIGAAVGALIGTLFSGGGSKENQFTLTELIQHMDTSFDAVEGFDPTKWQHGNFGNDWYHPIANAYSDVIGVIQEDFNANVLAFANELPAEMQALMLDNLAKTDFTAITHAATAGKWGVSSAQNVLEGVAVKYAEGLAKAVNDAYTAALSTFIQIADPSELLGHGLQKTWSVLSDAARGHVKGMFEAAGVAMAGGIEAGVEEIGKITELLAEISAAMEPIQEIIDTKDLTEYEKSLRAINKEFDDYAAALQAAGIDLARYTDLEEARAISLRDVVNPETEAIFKLEMQNLRLMGKEYEALGKSRDRELASIGKTMSILQSEVWLRETYKDILGREADEGGMEYWLEQLATGALTWEGILNSFLNSFEYAENKLRDVNRRVNENIESLINSLMGGSLAPVQSMEFFSRRFEQLYDDAKNAMGTAEYVDKVSTLTGFVPQFLDFSGSYADSGYGGIFDDIILKLRDLQIPGFAAGGLHSGGLRIVGENGPELEMTGPSRIFNQNQLGQVIAQVVRDGLSGRESNGSGVQVIVKIGTREIKDYHVEWHRTDPETHSAVRREVKYA